MTNVIVPERSEPKAPAMMPAPPTPPTPTGVLLRDNGVLMLTDQFNQEKIMPLVAQILEWNMMPEDKAPDHIKLYINSPGGSVHSAFHLIDTIKMSRIPVHTIAMGLAASCGCLTLMAGVKGHRYVTQNTSVMSHQYSWGSKGKEHELYGIIKEFEMASDRMIEHYKKCTGKSEKYIRKNLLGATDEWLTPEEVVKHGIADEVVRTY